MNIMASVRLELDVSQLRPNPLVYPQKVGMTVKVNKDQTKYGEVSFTSLPFHDGHSRLFQNGDCSSLVTVFISTSNKQQYLNL